MFRIYLFVIEVSQYDNIRKDFRIRNSAGRGEGGGRGRFPCKRTKAKRCIVFEILIFCNLRLCFYVPKALEYTYKAPQMKMKVLEGVR